MVAPGDRWPDTALHFLSYNLWCHLTLGGNEGGGGEQKFSKVQGPWFLAIFWQCIKKILIK
jgi:hypothetical protein